MKKIFHPIYTLSLLFSVFMLSVQASFAACYSSYQNPCCGDSYTVCKRGDCTTYCTGYRPSTVVYTRPGISFGFSTSGGSVYFSESYTGYFSPRIVISSGKGPHTVHRRPHPGGMKPNRPPVRPNKPSKPNKRH